MRRRGEVSSPEVLGRLLAQGRMLSGKSQRELAAEIGVGQKWIWELEQGKPGLFTERLFQVLRATGVTLSLEMDVPDGSAQGG